MARRTTTIEEDSEDKPEREVIGNVAVETIETVGESAAERIEAKMSAEGADPVSRIYREDLRKGSNEKREYLDTVYKYAGEEYIAENYGGGRYVVRYQWREKGDIKKSSLSFAISEDFRKKESQNLQSQPQNNAINSFLNGLTETKILAIAGAVKAVKELFSPQIDMTELVKALAINRPQAVGDQVIIEALKTQRPPEPPRPSLLSQIKEAQEAIDLLKGNENEETTSGSDTMDYVKMGLQLLPMLLQKNGQDYEAAGREAKNMPFIEDLIREDQTLATKFIEAAKNKYGDQAAKQLANGFGWAYGEQPAQIPEQPAQTAANGG